MVFPIHRHESAKGVQVSPHPEPPSQLSQCTRFECPASCTELALVFCFTYGNICVSMLFSQIIPLSPSPTESKVCCLHLFSFAVLHIGSSLPSIPYICINILYWCFFLWLTSLCIIGSSFIHLITMDSNVFFFYSWVIFHCVYVTTSLCICLQMDVVHLFCFTILVGVKWFLFVVLICISLVADRRRQWHPTPVLLPGKSHGRRILVGCRPWGRKESDTTERLHCHFSLSCIGEGNGNPLQCSCLEYPRDGGAW